MNMIELSLFYREKKMLDQHQKVGGLLILKMLMELINLKVQLIC